MRLSVFFPYALDDPVRLRAVVASAERHSYGRVWLGQSMALDAHTAMAAVASPRRKVGFGTAIAIMQLRHPVQAALEARTVAAASARDFVLGLGVSEPAFVEAGLGLPFGRPLGYAREYATIVQQALEGGRIRHRGDRFNVKLDLPPVSGTSVSVMLAALRPRMAHLAGEAANGCITWLTPPAYLADTLRPALDAGALAAGRPRPRLVAIVPCIAAEDEVMALDVARDAMGGHLGRPHYASMLAAAGLVRRATSQPLEVSDAMRDAIFAWGDERRIEAAIKRYSDAGADEIAVAAYLAGPEPAVLFERTLATVARVAQAEPSEAQAEPKEAVSGAL